MKSRFNSSLLVFLIAIAGFSFKAENDSYYTFSDFANVEKTDTHVHINGAAEAVAEAARFCKFKLLTINTDYLDFIPLADQEMLSEELIKTHKGIKYATTFSMDGWDDAGWEEKTIQKLKNSFKRGAIAVKIWKNIGMSFKDKEGNLIMIDHPRFDKIYSFLSKEKVPLLIHVGEPKNCWLPVEEMSVENDKKYFKEHPQYHMFLHSGMPSYETYIQVRDTVLGKHPKLKIVGCHLGSLEWSVEELAARLDNYPNFSVDLAARIGQIQYQTITDREKVRDFFIKYQDRIIYATDITTSPETKPEGIKKYVQNVWESDWKFFCTNDELTSPNVKGNFKGLRLPKSVVDKIYRNNAQRILGL